MGRKKNREEKIIIRHNKVAKWLFDYFFKKIQKQPPEVKKHPPDGFCKESVLKTFANFMEKHLRWSLFLIKLQAFSQPKETPTQVLSCEVSKTFKNVYFEEHLQMTASAGAL